MLKEKFFLNSDEDTDFMPIIPINENDSEQDRNLVIPDTLPILPLRNTVLFPGVVLPITVGRDKSIKAVNDAYKLDKLIGVLAQKDANIEEPEPKDLCKVGTVARVVKLIKMPDGGTTVIIQGKKRFALDEMINEDPYFKASVSLFADDEIPESENFNAYISSIKDLATQII
ncbi:MAG: LON peptidase substrate-binding domain-containing protein, partial [Sediminibacterium sp.]|nr:LON peptidase substrate-binding domain-containing protein [Sediminibacterium sp.]